MVSSLSSKISVLFIVEGASAEPKIIKKICSIIGNKDYEIYSYKTSIYELYDELVFDDDLDIHLLLREKESDLRLKTIFDKKYTRTYLVFDYDPHYQKFDHAKVKHMLSYFTESSDKGKLYINYPMMESHRHLLCMPDKAFLDRVIHKHDIVEYKRVVGDVSFYTDLSKYDYSTIKEMVAHHLIKYNYLLFGSKRLPDKSTWDDWSSIEDIEMLDLQQKTYSRDELYVLNTSIFYVIDIKPKTFFHTGFSAYSLE